MWCFRTLGTVRFPIKVSGCKEAEEIRLMEFLLPFSYFMELLFFLLPLF